ncbi:hypothetical protein MMC28_007310 [Mycoblastus sanguinarius]|nr:hypothetical protein [Mycoblastus sanguinarius]
MSIRNFLNPVSEVVAGSEEDITSDIVARYVEQREAEAESDDEVAEEVPVVKVADALSVLATLRRYEEQ